MKNKTVHLKAFFWLEWKGFYKSALHLTIVNDFNDLSWLVEGCSVNTDIYSSIKDDVKFTAGVSFNITIKAIKEYEP